MPLWVHRRAASLPSWIVFNSPRSATADKAAGDRCIQKTAAYRWAITRVFFSNCIDCLVTTVQWKWKGKTELHAVLPSHLEGRYCTFGCFRFSGSANNFYLRCLFRVTYIKHSFMMFREKYVATVISAVARKQSGGTVLYPRYVTDKMVASANYV